MGEQNGKKYDARYFAIILDCSGSMDSVRDATIRTVNEQIQTIEEACKQDSEVFVTLTLFRDTAEIVFFNKNISELRPLTRETYEPKGSTAELDAIGITIDHLEDEVEDNCPVTVFIISDGEENASRKFSRDLIAEEIKKLQATNFWTFAFVGANVDVLKEAASLGIPAGNTLSYANTDAGYRSLSATLSTATMASVTSGASSSASYFSPPIPTEWQGDPNKGPVNPH